MLLNSVSAIFIHVPKTAGNFCQNIFLDLGLTSDYKTVSSHQDGHHRFEVRSERTKSKHQDLASYRDTLGAAFVKYSVLVTLRDPVERLISLYLSPHRWYEEHVWSRLLLRPYVGLGRRLGGKFDSALRLGAVDAMRRYSTVTPNSYNYEAFAELVRNARSTKQFLALSEGRQPRSWIFLNFGTLANDLTRFLSDVGINVAPPVSRINQGSNQYLAKRMLGDSQIRDIVWNSHHYSDIELIRGAGAWPGDI